jgi:hypothetical protein
MPIVLAALVLVLAILVLRLRADARAGMNGRTRPSASDWLCDAVVDDRDRELALPASSLRVR